MSIQHRMRAARDRAEERGTRRGPRPAEFARKSDGEPAAHERAPASSREHAAADVGAAPPAVRPARKKKAARRRR